MNSDIINEYIEKWTQFKQLRPDMEKIGKEIFGELSKLSLEEIGKLEEVDDQFIKKFIMIWEILFASNIFKVSEKAVYYIQYLSIVDKIQHLYDKK